MKEIELPVANYTLVTDTQDLEPILDHFGINDFRDYVTAALVEVLDGDYGHVFFSENTNFKRSAHWDWEAPEYYEDYVPEELDLQE